MRVALAALVLLALAGAGPEAKEPVPLRDLNPRFVRGGRLYRSRTASQPGLFVRGKRHRGLSCPAPARVGFDLDGVFARLTLKVAVLDGARQSVAFRILGDGKPLAATPPLFAGSKPLAMEVRLDGVILLELVAHGFGAHAAWIDAELFGAPGADLRSYRSEAVSFSPQAYKPSFKRRINKAIDRGVGYLLLQQDKSGTWKSRRHRMGTTALVTLALLKAGAPPTDPSILRAFQYLRQQRYDHVYSVACLLMAIEAAYFPKGADPREAVRVIPEQDQAWIREAAEWLANQQGAGFPPAQRPLHPAWRYPGGGYDLSNTQYALFGLAAADRCGARMQKVWLPALRYILGAQEDEGPVVHVSRYFRHGDFMRRRTERAKARGFGYQVNSRKTGSMTSAGLCSLILCRAALAGTTAYRRGGWNEKTRAGIRDSLAWLEEYYDLEVNPFRGKEWWVYYLFNIERVGVLLDQRYLGTHDWYEEGARMLMDTQGSDGAIGGGTINTAFALLFLKRATVPPLTRRR